MKRIILSIFVIAILMANAVAVAAESSDNKEKGGKIDICHIPSENPENRQIVSVDKKEWEKGRSPHNYDKLDFVINKKNPCLPNGQPPGTNIPEFPTIALPLAAVIGMMFIFHKRRGR